MAQRFRLRCTENSELAGAPGRRLTFSPSLGTEENPNTDFFAGNPGGVVQLINVNPECAEKYEVGQEYDADLLVKPSGP